MSNYMKKLQKLIDEGTISLESRGLVVAVSHDTWCDQLSEKGACNCDPDIRLDEMPVRLTDAEMKYDVVTATAARYYGCLPAEVTVEQREFIKKLNYGQLYGMGAQRLSELTGFAVRDDLITRSKRDGDS